MPSVARFSHPPLLGKILNLKRLAQVIVAWDYDGALRTWNAEPEDHNRWREPMTASRWDSMTPRVLRDDEPRAVMVLNAAYMSVLTGCDSPDAEAMRERIFNTL